MKIPLDSVEQIMVECAVIREHLAKENLRNATERKNDVFRLLILKYRLQGIISVSDDFKSLEIPDPLPPPPVSAPPPPAPAAEPMPVQEAPAPRKSRIKNKS